MIYLYSGTPGSGKSFHLAKDIFSRLRVRKKPVIANFEINLDIVRLNCLGNLKMRLTDLFRHSFRHYNKKKGKIGTFFYRDNSELTVEWLEQYAREHHKFGREGQTLLIIDECATIFNARAWNATDRQKWIVFFQQHRKLGYNVILVSQNDRLIDRQIRAFVEYEVKHRSVKNYNWMGILVSLFSGGKLFAAVTYWYGVRERVGVEFIRFNRQFANIYNTYQIFR